MSAETITVTPLRRSLSPRTEPRPLRPPRSLGAKVQAHALGTLARVAPALTLDWLYNQYFTPLGYGPSARQREIMGEARFSRARVHGRTIAVYEWGGEPDFPWEQPPAKDAWLVHGWGGAAAQMTSFVRPLCAAGYRVRAFDAPAHGRSSGERTNVAEVAEILLELGGRTGDRRPGTIIAHSLGASSALIAAARGLVADAFVFLAPGTSLERYPVRFARAVGVSPALGEALRHRLLAEFGEDVLEPGAAPALDRALGVPALFVHDVDDAEMPHDDSRRLAARWPGARLITTAGLGHRRILEDGPVLEEVQRFLSLDGMGAVS